MTRSTGTPAAHCLLAAVALPLELARRVGVGVDHHHAVERESQVEQRLGRIESFGTGVDLDRRAGRGARAEDRLGVEGRLRAAASDQDPARAVAEDVGVRALDGPEHPPGHLGCVHPELGVHAGHDHVELREQLVVLVERPVLEDVDLDPGEDPERRQLVVQVADDLELLAQALGVRVRGRPSAGGCGR